MGAARGSPAGLRSSRNVKITILSVSEISCKRRDSDRKENEYSYVRQNEPFDYGAQSHFKTENSTNLKPLHDAIFGCRLTRMSHQLAKHQISWCTVAKKFDWLYLHVSRISHVLAQTTCQLKVHTGRRNHSLQLVFPEVGGSVYLLSLHLTLSRFVSLTFFVTRVGT